MAQLIFCNDITKELKKVSNNKKFSIADKRKLVDKVNLLSKEVHMEIFYFLYKIIVDNYTLNGNGVFINLNNIDNNTLHKLKKMVQFYNKNEKKLKTSYLKRYSNTKEETIKKSIKSHTIDDIANTSLIDNTKNIKYNNNKNVIEKVILDDNKSDELDDDDDKSDELDDNKSDDLDDNKSDNLDNDDDDKEYKK